MNNKAAELGVQKVCRTLRLTEWESVLAVGWHESEAQMRGEMPEFLTTRYVQQACDVLAMPENMAAAVGKAAHVMATDAHWRRLAWHAYWRAFEAEPPVDGLNRWPSFVDDSVLPGNLFYVVVTLGALPKVQQVHRRLNIPPDVAVATWRTWVGAVELHRQHFGTYGIVPATFNFYRQFVRGELFQLGRLQYHFNDFAPRLTVFRRHADSAVLALSEPDVAYRADGELYVPARGDKAAGAWTSVWREDDTRVTAHPITSRGKCLPRPVTISLNEWEPVFRRGDNVLQMHVPGGSSLDFAACGRSLQQAGVFFNTHFPQRPFKAYALNTWFLDDQLEHMLSPQSNVIRFQHEMYRHPVAGTTAQALRWLFGRTPVDLSEASRETSLQRYVLDHVLAGGIMTGGGGFILADELQWGESRYRQQHTLLNDIL